MLRMHNFPDPHDFQTAQGAWYGAAVMPETSICDVENANIARAVYDTINRYRVYVYSACYM